MYNVCMYEKFITRPSHSLSGHECTSVGRIKEISLACYKIVPQLWNTGSKAAWSVSGSPTRKNLQISPSVKALVAATDTCCICTALMQELQRCGLMKTLEDDSAEFVNYCLWNWQPVKIISKWRCYAIKLPLPHYASRSRVQNWLEGHVQGVSWNELLKMTSLYSVSSSVLSDCAKITTKRSRRSLLGTRISRIVLANTVWLFSSLISLIIIIIILLLRQLAAQAHT